MWDKFKYFMGCYGYFVAIGITYIVLLYDPLVCGLRGFLEWNLGPKGYLVIFVLSPAITIFSWLCDRVLE